MRLLRQRRREPFLRPFPAGVSAAGQPPPSPMDGFMRLLRERGGERAEEARPKPASKQ